MKEYFLVNVKRVFILSNFVNKLIVLLSFLFPDYFYRGHVQIYIYMNNL